MADRNFALGSALVIPKELFEQFDKVDKRLDALASKTGDTAKSMNASFLSMATGLNPLLEALARASNGIDALGSKKISSISTEMKSVGTSAGAMAAGMSKAVDLVDRLNGSKTSNVDKGLENVLKTINSMLDRLAKLRSDMDMYNQAIGTGKKSYIEFGQTGLKEANMEAEKLMRQIDALNELYSRLSKSSVHIDDITGNSFSDRRNADEMRKMSEYYRQMEKASRERPTYDAAMGVAGNATTINQRTEAIKLLNAALKNLSTEDADYASKKDALIQKARELTEENRRAAKTAQQLADEQAKAAEKEAAAQEKATAAAKRKAEQEAVAAAYQRNTTYGGSLSFAENATSINQRTEAIKYLQAARAKLSTTDSEYALKLKTLNERIRALNAANYEAVKSSQALHSSYARMMNVTEQLGRAFSLLFSVSQVRGYIQSIAEVRGEFELQQRSLQSILQNKNDADVLFNKTVALAVNSPFQVKDLVTYTKQLAAYRIESDKLYDTTKMLADVSAGLGVSMDRLILAYGQVKAAAYLRGSEVRQFTEAGVNMYGELQRYFQEVKGEAYTTAQIVDMISKRKVTFEDVEKVFQRMTGKGGIFYNMQEIQSETLAGKIANFKDSIDLMLNEIGKANEGIFKGAIDAATALLGNWDKLVTAAKGLIAALLLLKLYSTQASIPMSKMFSQTAKNAKLTTTSMQLMTNGMKNLSTAMSSFATNMKAAFFSNLPLIALTAIITAISEVVSRVNEYKEAVASVTNEYFSARVRVNGITDESKTNVKKALKDLIEEMNKAGFDITINPNINEKEAQRQFDTYLYEYENFLEERRNLGARIAANYAKRSWFDDSAKQDFKDFDAAVGDFLHSGDELQTTLAKAADEGSGFSRIARHLFKTLSLGPREGEETIDYLSRVANAIKNNYDAISEIRDYRDNPSIENLFGGNDAKEGLSELIGYYDLYRQAIEEAERELKNLGINLDKEYSKSEKRQLSVLIDTETAKGTWSDMLASMMKERLHITTDIDESGTKSKVYTLIDDLQSAIDGRKLKISVDIGMDGGTYADAVEKLEKDAKSWKESLNAIGRSGLNWIHGSTLGIKDKIKFNGKYVDQDTVFDRKEAQKFIKEYYNNAVSLMKLAGGSIEDKDAKKRQKEAAKTERDIISARISALKDLQAAYESLRKVMSSTDAARTTMREFKDVLDYVGMDSVAKLDPNTFIPTKEEIANVIDKDILPTIKDRKKRFEEEKWVAEVRAQVKADNIERDMEIIKKRVETAFNGLELRTKLENFGLDSFEIEKLFPGLSRSLEDVRESINKSFGVTGELASAPLDKLRESMGEMQFSEYQRQMDSLNKREIDSQRDTLEQLLKDYKTKLSEQLQLDIWYFRERTKIETNKTLNNDEPLRGELLDNLKKEYERKTSENAWNQFKGSEEYISFFKNLEYASTSSIKRMLDKIDELKSSLSSLDPSDLREITENVNRLRQAYEEKNPFRAFVEYIKEYNSYLKESQRLEKELADTEERISRLQEERILLLSQMGLAQENYANAIKNYGENSQEAKESYDNLQNIQKALRGVSNELSIAESKLSDVSSKISDGESKGTQAGNSLVKSTQQISQAMGAVLQNVRDLNDNWEQIFGGQSQAMKDTLDSIIEIGEGQMQVMEGAGQFVMGYLTGNPMQMIQGIGNSISGTVKTISAIFRIGDKKKEREIQRLSEAVDRLTESYEDLKKAQDEAWNVYNLEKYTQEMVTNLKLQNQNLQSMIAAERDKKKTDENRIREWEQQIKANNELIAETVDNFTEALGGLGSESNYKSAAQQFADAWVDAFSQGEDAVAALEGELDDLVKTLAAKQISMRLMEKWLQPIFDMIDDAVSYTDSYNIADALNKGIPGSYSGLLKQISEGIGEAYGEDAMNMFLENFKKDALTKDIFGAAPLTSSPSAMNTYLSELQQWVNDNLGEITFATTTEQFKEQMDKLKEFLGNGEYFENMSEEMEALLDALGLGSMLGEGMSDLSALQQGIQGVTEETASALESILNSIRFFLATQQADVATIKNFLLSRGDMVTDSETTSPILTEMRNQTSLMRDLKMMWERVIKPMSNGYGLRVIGIS